MKKLLSVILTICALMSVFVFAQETNPVTVTLNGETIDCAFYGQDATIVEGRTLVPLRAIFEALGATVEWNQETKTVTSVLDKTEIKLTIGENVLYKNEEAVELDVPAMIMNNRTLVPVRAISESFGVSVEWDGETRTVILAFTENENDELVNDYDFTRVYGDFYFGMSMEEAKAAAKGEITEVKKYATSFETQKTVLQISDKNNEFDDEDWRITGNLNCTDIELSFKSDILYSVNVKIEHQENFADALKVYDKITDYYNADEEIIKSVLTQLQDTAQWLIGQENEVDESALFEDDKLIKFPKKIDKFDSVSCFLNEKRDDNYQKIGYYTSFEITNLWYYQYAKEHETEPEFADLLIKLPFGATKQQTMGIFTGKVIYNGNRIDILDVQDETIYVYNPLDKYYPENDIYGLGFDCNYISLEYDDAGLDKFYARTKEYGLNEATHALNVILDLYGGYNAVFHEAENTYEWKGHKYKTQDGVEKSANIFAGIVMIDKGTYYCFVSGQTSREDKYFTIDEEGRIIGTDYPHAYGRLFFGMTMQQASEVIKGEQNENSSIYRIEVFDKENVFDDEDENITGNMNFESMEVLFDTKKKTLCYVSAVSSEVSSEQVEDVLESLKKHYGDEDEARVNKSINMASYLWTLREKNALVNFDVTEVADNQYVCTYSITLAGSSMWET